MIRVLIERCLADGKISDYYQAIRQLKQKASHMDGYLSGEMLVDPEDSRRCMILSNWESLESWKAWAKSDKRNIAKDKIRKMLVTEERVSIYEAPLNLRK